MTNSEIGYIEEPINGDGITRARTTKQIRSWEFQKELATLEALNDELGRGDFPGIYILFEGKKKIYIGEAKNIYKRIKTHFKTPDDKIKNLDRVLIINDGRPAAQSDFNDAVVRLSLEYFLIKLFKINKYQVVSQGEPQNLNSMQKLLFNSFLDELNFFLMKKNIITKLIEHPKHELIHKDKLKKIILNTGRVVQNFSAYEATIDGRKVFIREGSNKLPRGWQITFRDIFKNALQSGDADLLVPRGSVLLVPMTEIQKLIKDDTEYQKNTIDIFVVFEEERILLRFKQNVIDVSNYKLIP